MPWCRREVVREGQPVHAAADDDDVVGSARARAARGTSGGGAARSRGHLGRAGVLDRARADVLAPIRRARGAGGRRVRGGSSRRRGRRRPGRTHPRSAPPSPRGTRTRRRRRRRRASQARPAVGDVEDEGVAVDRGDPVLELATDVRDHGGLHDHQRLVGGESQRAGAVAGGARARSRAAGSAAQTITPTGRSRSSGTQAHPLGVVEGGRRRRSR